MNFEQLPFATIDHLRRGAPETVPLESEEDDKGGLAAVLAELPTSFRAVREALNMLQRLVR